MTTIDRTPRDGGHGPLCPANPRHGRLIGWDTGEYFCPHNDHGGNGRFFTDTEARGAYQMTERNVNQQIRAAAQAVADQAKGAKA